MVVYSKCPVSNQPLNNISTMYTPHTNTSHKGGFTIVELLVVIAVIGIITSILVVAIGSARKRADETASISNLRHLGMLFQMYASDNKGSLPHGYIGIEEGWDRALVNAGVIEEDDLKGVLHAPAHEADGEFPRSYSMSRGNFDGVAQTVETEPATTLFKVENPEKTLLLVERLHPANSYGWSAFSVTNSPTEQMDPVPERSVFNYLFVDGHVESLEPIQTIGKGTLKAPKGYWSVTVAD